MSGNKLKVWYNLIREVISEMLIFKKTIASILSLLICVLFLSFQDKVHILSRGYKNFPDLACQLGSASQAYFP